MIFGSTLQFDNFSTLNTRPPDNWPFVMNTWPFTEATDAAWHVLQHHKPGERNLVLDAVEIGASTCEVLQCDGTVGYGGSPDENGETTLDALIMDGDTLEVGAVANLRHIREAVAVARLVLQHTQHSLLAGLQAAEFATSMGLKPTNLSTEGSAKLHARWLANDCQPNFRKSSSLTPNPWKHCGPYHPKTSVLHEQERTEYQKARQEWVRSDSAHDTIAMIAIDSKGSMAASCSTNGAIHKVPGRVGDAAVAGGGAYVDSEVGGCGATGDGDVHLRFLPCFQVVENMRLGMSPQEAAETVIRRIAVRLEGRYTGAVVAVNRRGEHGAAAHGWEFRYSYRDRNSNGVKVVDVLPLKLDLI